jgi:hypothetical protein
MWSWTPWREEYKGYRLEASGQYINVLDMSGERPKLVWNELIKDITKAKKWIDRQLTIQWVNNPSRV